jgi:hypothetical protein
MAGLEAAGVRRFPRLAWGPIIAGVLLALAAQVVLGLVGATFGLAAGRVGSSSLGVLAGFWGLVTPLVAMLLGAWLACRLAAIEEVGATNLHGIMVWCIGVIAGALFLTGTASGALSTAAVTGDAGSMQRLMRQPLAGQTEAADAEEGAAARIAGGAAMAGLAGLLGAFAGAAIARSGWKGKGLGWRIAIQRTAQRRESAHGDGGAREYPDQPYPTAGQSRDEERTEGPGERPPGSYPH